MQKVIRVGTIPTWSTRRASVYCKISFKDGKLSISGVIGPLPSGNALGGCGQIDMEFKHRDPKDDDARYNALITPEQFKYAPGWDTDKWLKFLDIWKRHHLNDMQAGCEHQRALGWDQAGYAAHPSEPCPECGYKFGTEWKSATVPAEVTAWLESLPDADKSPAWV